MKIIISHPTSNQNNRAVLQALMKQNMLKEYHTTFASFPGSLLYHVGGIAALSDIRRRSFQKEIKSFTHISPIHEIGRMLSGKLGFSRFIQHETGSFCLDVVYQQLDKKVSRRLKNLGSGTGAVYAYEDGALHSFKVAKELGLKCIYELPIAYWETGRKLMQQEADRLPNWAITLGGGIRNSAAKLERKTKELELADVVIVPGKFVMDSLPKWAKSKQIIISPFGSPQTFKNKVFPKQNLQKPLRVLFVGSMGQRKGLGDLFLAMKLIKKENVELVVLGSLLAPMEFYRNELQNFVYEPCRSHEDVLKLMQTCDILCLPSIVEGRALVMQEAMSQGLPLIITPNTGGEDLIKEYETGFLVPIRNPEAIAEKIMWFVNNKKCVEEMGFQAKSWAETYTWNKYSERIANELMAYLEEPEDQHFQPKI